MQYVKDYTWKKNLSVSEFTDKLGSVGFQSIEVKKAVDIILNMKREGVKILLTFTSNMVTSGLRGFFAQLSELRMCDIIVTTTGAIEEDIMRSVGEKFIIHDFNADDIELYEKGSNRVGNLLVANESYERFESLMQGYLKEAYGIQKRWAVSELLEFIGSKLEDNSSILYQCHKNNIAIFCPGITDGALGFHLFMFQQKNPDFIVDVVKDFANIIFTISHDDKKGVITLGGGISKHHAILASLLNGGLDYAVYLTTSQQTSGSMGGATTKEARSWGKIKDESCSATVIGDVTITFPLIMSSVLEKLSDEGIVG